MGGLCLSGQVFVTKWKSTTSSLHAAIDDSTLH